MSITSTANQWQERDGTHAAGNAGIEGTNSGIAKENALSDGQAIFTDIEASGNMN
jgi:hypothetical protein